MKTIFKMTLQEKDLKNIRYEVLIQALDKVTNQVSNQVINQVSNQVWWHAGDQIWNSVDEQFEIKLINLTILKKNDLKIL